MGWETETDASALREILRAVQFDGVAMSIEEVGRLQARIAALKAAPVPVVEATKKPKK